MAYHKSTSQILYNYNVCGLELPNSIIQNNVKHKVDIKAVIFDYDKTLSENDV